MDKKIDVSDLATCVHTLSNLTKSLLDDFQFTLFFKQKSLEITNASWTTPGHKDEKCFNHKFLFLFLFFFLCVKKNKIIIKFFKEI